MYALALASISLHAKFKVPSFTDSKTGAQKFKNVSHFLDHSLFTGGLSSIGNDLL